jgi:starch synthase
LIHVPSSTRAKHIFMEIAFVSSEIAPWVKVGGLADVTLALPKALRGLDHKVSILVPKYPAFDDSGLLLARRLSAVAFQHGGKSFEAVAYDTRLPSQVDLTVIEIAGVSAFTQIYEGDSAAGERFALFSAAAAAIIAARNQPFDVVHLNDWPTALVCRFLKERNIPSKIVLTVHNGAYQGSFAGLSPSQVGLSEGERVNFLEQGLRFADVVTTVSPSYGAELLTEPGGAGLSQVYGALSTLTAVLNGIDYSVWNPATDSHLPSRYDAEDPGMKVRCKTELQRELGFQVDPDAPVVAFVGRLTDQKGVADLLAALPSLVRATNASFVIAGAGEHADKVRACVSGLSDRAHFLEAASERNVHRIFGGASVVLVPSVFEPCGLVQMYAQRYGALPVARAVGGLRDTIVDLDSSLETGTGVLYDAAGDLEGATLRALSLLGHTRYPALMRRMMRLDRSWDRAARLLERVYR